MKKNLFEKRSLNFQWTRREGEAHLVDLGEPNVLLLHYTDAKKDLGGVCSKLAKFLNVQLLPWQSATAARGSGSL